MSAPKTLLKPGELHELRARLLAERRRVAGEYESDVERERAIPVDAVGDLVDRAETAADREDLLTAAEDELERLRLIDDALWRLREGTYGMCLVDGEPIALSRLQALPWARYCIAHQEQWEAEHRTEERLPAHASR